MNTSTVKDQSVTDTLTTTDREDQLISALIDETVWSPTDAEVRSIYPPHRWETMLKIYGDASVSRERTLKFLIAKRDARQA